MADDPTLGFRHPGRQGIGGGEERPQIGGQVGRIAIPFMNDFRQPDACIQVALCPKPHPSTAPVSLSARAARPLVPPARHPRRSWP